MTARDLLTCLDQLQALAVECAEPGWSGDPTSVPPTTAVLRAAMRAVYDLPYEISAPDVGMENDGSPTLEWRAGRSTLSVSVGADGWFDWALTQPSGPQCGRVNALTAPPLLTHIRAMVDATQMEGK